MVIDKASRNIKYSLLNYILVNALKFIVRIFFVQALPLEYLGINGLFSNILTMLSLAELGIGSAIVYSLYKPLALNDNQTVGAIMQLFKKAYTIIGLTIFGVGLLLVPWLDWFIKGNTNIEGLEIFYILFLLNTAVSYFWSYNRNLLIADQKQYLVNIYQTAVQILVAVLQIILLYLLPDYRYYLGVMIAGTVLENICITWKAKATYEVLNNPATKLASEIKGEIIKNTKAMVIHKLASMIVFSSANIILAKFVGLVAVGLYSNYVLVITALNALGGKFFEAVTASVGNILVLETQEKKIKAFETIEFFTAYQASLMSVGLYVLFNDFIELWLGKEYLFDEATVTAIVIAFYLHYMRKAVLMFRDAGGLFYEDRYKAIVEAILNFTLSIYLAIEYGTFGVICGGIASTLLTCFWVEPFILFRYALQMSLKSYFLKYLQYVGVTMFCVWTLMAIKECYATSNTILDFGVIGIAIIIVVTTIWIVAFNRSSEYKTLRRILKKGG